MNISMSDIICITDRECCVGDYFARLDAIAAAKPLCIILRAPGYPAVGYPVLAAKVRAICGKHGVPCVLHGQGGLLTETAQIHLPLPLLRELKPEQRAAYKVIGASVHSLAEAAEAVELGADYLIAGHIFATSCKPDKPGRGIPFLREICRSVSVPVYAIGGITPENIAEVRAAGAAGACVRSGLMRCADPAAFLEGFTPCEEQL